MIAVYLTTAAGPTERGRSARPSENFGAGAAAQGVRTNAAGKALLVVQRAARGQAGGERRSAWFVVCRRRRGCARAPQALGLHVQTPQEVRAPQF